MTKSKALSRAEVEEFLINEAALLDDWRLPSGGSCLRRIAAIWCPTWAGILMRRRTPRSI